jgi:predicted RNA binding protein YcfA (HicA-like mRNA interferase family)
MKPLSFREVRRKLLRVGFVEAGQTGSHIKFAMVITEGTLTTIVPRHREIASGTLRSILRQAGLSEKEFIKL